MPEFKKVYELHHNNTMALIYDANGEYNPYYMQQDTDQGLAHVMSTHAFCKVIMQYYGDEMEKALGCYLDQFDPIP